MLNNWFSKETKMGLLALVLTYGGELFDEMFIHTRTKIQMRSYYDDAMCEQQKNKCWIVTKK